MLKSLRLWWHRYKTRRKMNRVFSRGADPYHYRSSPYEISRLEAMEAGLGARSYAHALEVGCAEGAFTERLSRHAARVTAIDISSVALARARARLGGLPQMELVEADIRDWSPPDQGGYDLIVLGDVLYYLDKPLVQGPFEQTFPRVRSWLKPGGRLLLAHGFAGPAEKIHRESFGRRFAALGLKPVEERIIEGGESSPGVSCLLSVLDVP